MESDLRAGYGAWALRLREELDSLEDEDPQWGLLIVEYLAQTGGAAAYISNGGCTGGVDRFFPSSKLCGACGAINQELKLEDREWVCTSCGCLHDRDHNASSNIEVEALRVFRAQGVACA